MNLFSFGLSAQLEIFYIVQYFTFLPSADSGIAKDDSEFGKGKEGQQ
jgi:hypothetical protein